jgi:hypothetical protein
MSPRSIESKIINLKKQGFNSKEIASKLKITQYKVKYVLKKLGLEADVKQTDTTGKSAVLKNESGINIDKLYISFDKEQSCFIDFQLKGKVSYPLLKAFSESFVQKFVENFNISSASEGISIVQDHEAFEEFLNKWSFEFHTGTNTITAYPRDYFTQYLRNVNNIPIETSESEVYKMYLQEPIVSNRLGIINAFLRANALIVSEWFKFKNSQPNPAVFKDISNEELKHFISNTKAQFERWHEHTYGGGLHELETLEDRLTDKMLREAYISYIISDIDRFNKFVWWCKGDKDEQAPN